MDGMYTPNADEFSVDAPCFQTIYNAMLENNCSEHASRMSAMENSTKSAGEMLNKLTLSYNRWDSGREKDGNKREGAGARRGGTLMLLFDGRGDQGEEAVRRGRVRGEKMSVP